MHKTLIVAIIAGFLALGLFTASGQAPVEKQSTFLSSLKVGQQVTLRDVSGRYEISTLEGVVGVQGHKVIEVASDFIVVQDIAGVIESRIPIFSIKAITRLKVPKK